MRQGRALALNVGDSRAYFVSGGEIRQLTKDQSYVQHLVDLGEITPQEALKHPAKEHYYAGGRRIDGCVAGCIYV